MDDREPCTTLKAEVRRAFFVLAEVPGWTREFNSAAYDRKARLYEKPLHGINLDCVLPGVEQIIATSDFPPTPAKLAATCWRIHRERYPEAPSSQPAYEDETRKAEAKRLETIQRRFNERAAYLRDHHGIKGARECSEVWGYLLRMAETPEQRKAVQEGAVKRTTIDTAVRMMREDAAQAARFTTKAGTLGATVAAIVEAKAANQ